MIGWSNKGDDNGDDDGENDGDDMVTMDNHNDMIMTMMVTS